MTDGVNPKDILPFLEDVAQRAGNVIASRFQGDFRVHRKDTVGGIDIVTDVDRASEDLILEAIGKEFPRHDVMTEESLTQMSGSKWLWVVDPLDGTVNFAHGIPHFAVSIALAEGDGLVAGIIYEPLRHEKYCAARGHGALLNGEPMRVSHAATLQTSVVATGFPYDRASSPENNVAEFVNVVTRVQGMRRAGTASLDLAYVACGRLDGFWELKLKPWDQAAGMLLVEEAGGRVSDRSGHRTTFRTLSVVATNGLIHEELVRLLKINR